MESLFSVDVALTALHAVLAISGALTLLLLARSIIHFSQTGPKLPSTVLRQFRAYAVFAMGRLLLWAFLLTAGMASAGVLIFRVVTVVAGIPFGFANALAAGFVGVLLVTGVQFCRHLLYLPASIATSYGWRKSRLYLLWKHLSPSRLIVVEGLVCGTVAILFGTAAVMSAHRGHAAIALAASLLVLAALAVFRLLRRPREPQPVKSQAHDRLNVLMIGCDTLRADRLSHMGYHRPLTPFIDALARRGTSFASCYVPCARTAPSLLSILTGTWPHIHGVRDNFVSDDETRLTVPALPELLRQRGYRTGAVSDWCGGDLGKFSLGFEDLDLPSDQWNLRYFIRQGPKDLRLFLTLFTNNRFGKRFLPELYYLAGIPMTRKIGRDARRMLGRYAASSSPFFLNVFMSTAHPPFGSEWPYHRFFSDPDYRGESKFAMERLTDPWEIIKRQGEPREEFDLAQIIDLYDGCVRNFDDEVARIVQYLRACDLEKNTIIVVYSDHGMEFFERGTWGQGNSVLTEASGKIPLVLADPRYTKGHICQNVVRSVDLAPTILDLLGVPIPPSMNGVSLRPYLEQTNDMNLTAYNETGLWLTEMPGMVAGHLRYPGLLDMLDVPSMASGTLAIKPEFIPAIIAAKDRMIRQGNWKLVYQPTSNGPLISLYNVLTDKDCEFDVLAEHPAISDLLLTHLREYDANFIGITK
ncbi:MAG: sulfatase-like hydrolase/transferase [Burkholderiales bacterium]